MTENPNIFQTRWGTPAFSLPAAYVRQLVAQALNNWIYVYMRASSADLLRESVS